MSDCGIAWRLHDRRQPLHLGSNPADRRHSDYDASADRRLGLGLRSLPARLPADARRGPLGRCAVGAAGSAKPAARRWSICFGCDSGTFRRRFEQTAMGWRGAAVLRRNAAVALGNALDRSTVGPLAESLCADPHPMVRGHAAWALGRIGSPAALEALRGRSTAEPSDEVRAEISMALQPFHSRRGVCSTG